MLLLAPGELGKSGGQVSVGRASSAAGPANCMPTSWVPTSPPAHLYAHLLQVVSQEIQLGLAVHRSQLSPEPRTDALGLSPHGVMLEELVLGILETQPFPPACRGNAGVGVVARLGLPA